jgi:hypothetical protein
MNVTSAVGLLSLQAKRASSSVSAQARQNFMTSPMNVFVNNFKVDGVRLLEIISLHFRQLAKTGVFVALNVRCKQISGFRAVLECAICCDVWYVVEVVILYFCCL